ncbi:MAG: lytic murein transglycosylase [Alphaproteobacteria bacterium]|nr:lytic murein transglycosylase [Alphaproteobacteria bacterium]
MQPLRLSRRVFLAASFAAAPVGVGVAADAEGDFNSFIAGVRRDAIAQGIRASTVDVALRRAEYLPHVIELDRKQPERTMTFGEYIDKFVTPQRKDDARHALAENWALLGRVRQRFDVQPRFVVALWGMESAFGKITGNYSVVSALATLAYDGRRSSYFRGELIAALRILDQGHIRPDDMLGSWAGAMGQCQFMPSTFLSYAVDFDGDGRRDIWNDRADVLGSIANFISRLGWRGDQSWGRDVLVPANFDPRLAGLDTRRSIMEWNRLGVRGRDSGLLPAREADASLVLPDGPAGPALLVYDNFRTIMKWNKSTYFAAAVGYLADSMDQG